MCIPGSLGIDPTVFCYIINTFHPGIRKSGMLLCEPDTAECPAPAPVNISLVASSMCRAWAHMFTFLRPDGVGTQISQDNAIGSWLPCSVFCQTNTGTWYSPRRELKPYYLSAMLPDGTLCSNNEVENLYCQVSSKWKKEKTCVIWKDSLCLPISKNGFMRSIPRWIFLFKNPYYNKNCRNIESEKYSFDDEFELDEKSRIIHNLVNPE